MRILKVIFIVLGAAIVGVLLAAVIFIKTFDVNRFKPRIVEAAQAALKRSFNFQGAGLNLSFAGLRLDVKNIAIGRELSSSAGDFCKIKNLSLDVDLFSFLKKRQLLASDLNIEASEIFFTPVKDPVMNLKITGARLAISGFSLNGPFSFRVQAAILGQEVNTDAQGQARVLVDKQGLVLNGVDINADLSKLSPAELKESLPMLKDLPLPQDYKGRLRVKLDKLEAGAKGLVSLAAHGELLDAGFRLKEIPLAVEALKAEFQITEANITIKECSGKLAKGRLSLSGGIEDYLTRQDFSFEGIIEGIQAAELINQKEQPVKIQGAVFGNFKVEGQGWTPDALRRSLKGQAKVEMKEARLMDLNILETVLSKISMLPNLAEKMNAALPERFREKLRQKDTFLTKAECDMVIAGGQLRFSPAQIAADEFLVSAQGSMDFDRTLSLTGSLAITQELSAAMTQAVEQLQYILSENKEILIPFAVSGKPPDLNFNVDLQYLGERLMINRGVEELGRIISKALGKNKGPAQENTQDAATPSQTQGQKEKSAEQELIEGILGSILKKNK